MNNNNSKNNNVCFLMLVSLMKQSAKVRIFLSFDELENGFELA